MEKYLDIKIVVSAMAAALLIGALVKYGRQVPVVGGTVADLAALGK